MVMTEIDGALFDAITDLSPVWVDDERRFADGLDFLVRDARLRRGDPETQTGALARHYLVEGALLRGTLPRPEHGLDGPWQAGIVAVDVRSLLRINDQLGMEAGERTLRVVADGLRGLYPQRPVVRLHGDAYAALLLPPHEHRFAEGTPERVRERLAQLTAVRVPELSARGLAPAFTVAALDLVIDRPFHWRVLGPLVWAEAERALAVVRTGRGEEVQRRKVSLDGFVT
jgi:GGDEF domain-containing protein